ncbi:unnamed protein product [Ectocarpus sp. 4 AP-2014]
MHALKPSLERARCFSSAVAFPHAWFGQLDKDSCTHEPENPRIRRGMSADECIWFEVWRGLAGKLEPNEARKELPDRVP